MGQENQAGAVAALRRQREPEHGGLLAEEAVGHLREDARAVAGIGLAAARAAVLQVDEDLQRLLHDRVRAAALDVRDEADAARIVFMCRVIETLSRRELVFCTPLL